ncbi:hypothetical protein BDR03DRAFT_1007901 [Suillus americanus]|nr:hypothetical protein BDR03DRAFT_1007901 [Suillus americanus]
MLDKAGIVEDTSDSTTMNVCADCFTALSKQDSVPRFALTNGLYCGELLTYFKDLTWVEEKICAIHNTMAHVTRLFQSSDPLQPKVFHGNICAHDMNIVSTASVLPRTPADVNGFLSIVFVGPDDDMLPGLSDRVVENNELDVKRVFEEETAGFQEHPAELLVDDLDVDSDMTMLEKAGVSDPECDNISG